MSQSAYKQFHFEETALLKVHNDINLNIDNGKVTALTLLDLSAALDTIDHNIFIKRLSRWYGISGTAIWLVSSYLTDRRQLLLRHAAHLMLCPQGSVFGAYAFHSAYNAIKLYYPKSQLELSPLRRWHTNMYLFDHTRYTCRSLNQLRDCLQDVSVWMTNSQLKLNANNTEFIIIGISTQRAKLDGFFLTHILS